MSDFSLEKRFSMVELFQMFNLELSPNGPPVRPTKNRADDFAFEIVRLPLWKVGKRRIKKRRFKRGFPDFLNAQVSRHPAGSKERIADLTFFYARQSQRGTEISPFD